MAARDSRTVVMAQEILCSPKGTLAEVKRLCNITKVGKNLHEEHQIFCPMVSI